MSTNKYDSMSTKKTEQELIAEAIDQMVALAEDKPYHDLDSAQEWIKKKSKEYGSKNEFLSSQEYKDHYPHIEKLHNASKSEHASVGQKALSDAGQKEGDEVYYDHIGPFMSVTKLRGKIVHKDGVPHVRLTEPVDGKRHIQWHKGFKKTS